MKNDTFREVIGTQTYYIPATNMTATERRLHTHHPLFAEESPEHYEGCIGGKSGSTEAAGKTLVTGAEQNGVTYLVVVMKGADMAPNCLDTTNLFNYGYQNFEKKQLNEGSIILPKGITLEQLEKTEEQQEDGSTLIRYSLGAQYLGSEKKEMARPEKKDKKEIKKQESVEGEQATDTNSSDNRASKEEKISLTSILLILMAALIILMIVLLVALIRHDRKKKRRRKNRKRKR